MTLFCKHDWDLILDKTLPSFIERTSLVPKEGRPPMQTMEGTHIAIVSCKKCGKLDKTITKY